MNLQNKTAEWCQNALLSAHQRQAILRYETHQRSLFQLLGLIWLGIFIFVLGCVSFVAEHHPVIPLWGQVFGWSLLAIAGIFGLIYALRHGRKLLLEGILFFTFLIVGGGIGLIAQIFNFPVNSAAGLLGWALLSLIIVLFSDKELLSLLWIPLFLGGLIGYLRLELLFLFLAQAPVTTTCLLAGGFLILLFLTARSAHPFLRAVNHWSLALFFIALILGENSLSHPFGAFIITLLFLSLLLIYAVHTHHLILFNCILLLLGVRFVLLCFDVFRFSGQASVFLIAIGLLILSATGGYFMLTSPRVNKP